MENKINYKISPDMGYMKYLSDNYKVLSGIFREHKIRFTQPWALNDPLEFNPKLIYKAFDNSQFYKRYRVNGVSMPSIEQFLRMSLIETNINEYGILSLSKYPYSVEMWNNYANGHKGILLELKSDFLSSSHFTDCLSNEPKEIEYVEDYSIVLDDLVSNDNSINITDLLNELFYKKNARWEYEEEYRVVRPIDQAVNFEDHEESEVYQRNTNVYLFDFPLEAIETIVFGAHTSRSIKEMIFTQCEDLDIDYMQSFVLRDKKDQNDNLGTVAYTEIGEKYLTKEAMEKIEPQHFTTEEESFNHLEFEELNRLDALPYYKGKESETVFLYTKREED